MKTVSLGRFSFARSSTGTWFSIGLPLGGRLRIGFFTGFFAAFAGFAGAGLGAGRLSGFSR